MAGGGQERTEQPTSKKRRDARKEGNILVSKDIVTIIMLFGIFWAVRLMLPQIYKTVRAFMEWSFSGISGDTEQMISSQLFTILITSFVKCALPLLLISILLSILSHGVQSRFFISFKQLRPKLERINPLSGIKKLFSLRNLIELIKSLIKIVLLAVLLYNLLKEDLVLVARMIDMQVISSLSSMLGMIFDLIIKVCGAFAVVAFFDYLYQWWQYKKDLMMTKQEVKDEHKQLEGNPKIKGRIRSIQRRMAQSRMMQNVPSADVIIKNPTHYAVAIKYDPERNAAPLVLAKGQDELALRIIRTGEENNVFIMENKTLARSLYASCELNREIPEEFYGAVAELLVYIYKAGHKEDIFKK